MTDNRQLNTNYYLKHDFAGGSKKHVVYSNADKENGQVAVPESSEQVIQNAFVGLGFVLVLFKDDKDVLAQEIGAACKT